MFYIFLKKSNSNGSAKFLYITKSLGEILSFIHFFQGFLEGLSAQVIPVGMFIWTAAGHSLSLCLPTPSRPPSLPSACVTRKADALVAPVAGVLLLLLCDVIFL